MCTTCVPGHIGIWSFIESECSTKHRFPGNKDNSKDVILRAEPDFKRILKLLYPRNGQWLFDIHLKLFLFPWYYALQKHWNENYVIQSRCQHNSTRTFNSKLKKTKRVLHQCFRKISTGQRSMGFNTDLHITNMYRYFSSHTE